MRPFVRGFAVTLALLVLLPIAEASEVVGHLKVGGPIEFEGPTTATTHGTLGAFVPDASALRELHGSWPVVTVHRFTESYVETEVFKQHARPLTWRSEPVWALHDVELSLAAPGAGWVGLHPGAGTFSAMGDRLQIEAADGASVGNDASRPGPDELSQAYFLARADHPVTLLCSSSWSFAGPGVLKIMGPSVVLRSRENTTTFVTGEDSDADPTYVTHRWLTLEFDAGTLQASGAPTRLLAGRQDVSWSGTARMTSANGAVDGAARAWTASGPSASLDGDLLARIVPDRDGIAMDVSGDLRDATLESHVVVPRPPAGLAWWPIALAGAVAGGGLAWVAAARRDRRRLESAHSVGPDEFAELASVAAERGAFDEAASWAARARELSPTSHRAAIDHAYFLAKSGDTPRAVSILDGPLLRGDADAALVLVMVLLDDGEDARAARALVGALDRHPDLVLEIGTDPQIARLLERPEVARAARSARRALERTGADEGT